MKGMKYLKILVVTLDLILDYLNLQVNISLNELLRISGKDTIY